MTLRPGLIAIALLSIPLPLRAQGEVKLPLAEWTTLLDRIESLEKERQAPPAWALASRRLEVRFERGVLRGRLEAELEATVRDGPLAVPLIGAAASLGEVRLDGARAVATRRGSDYAVLVAASGRHRAELAFAAGEEQDRFARAFRLELPAAPVTSVSLELPEPDIDVEIEGGVVTSQVSRGSGTRVEAALGGASALVVRWQRRLSHEQRTRELEARAYVLAAVREDVLRAETVVVYRVLAGETARLELELPPALEVTQVTGEAVLQWTTEPAQAGARKLIVLLRHLVEEGVEISVHTQLPRTGEATVLELVRPLDATLREGFIAVEGRAGMEIAVTEAEGVTEVGTRELPSELLELSHKPLLFGYRYEATPRLLVAAKRNATVELTEAVIDELEAATVVVEQGLEITKLRLFVRNNTRQYLGLRLPPDAILTHALLDGTPFHPAVSRPAGGEEELLIPLRQSERVAGRALRQHRVRPGDTLGSIALRYFNKVDRVRDILEANPHLSAHALTVGQLVAIPRARAGASVEESTFVVELAYKTTRPRLSLIGSQETLLPALDLPVMALSWQYFFPAAFEPVAFDTNLKQHTRIRYGLLERASQFLGAALSGRDAWAGGSYQNILKTRKAIFRAEQKTQVTEALASFPLVGERYRFSRVLLGDRQAQVGFVYLHRGVAPPVRAGAFVLALLGAFWLVRVVRRDGLAALAGRRGLALGLAAISWLVVAHYVLGVHRALLWGANLGLLASLAHARLPQARERLRAAPPVLEWPALFGVRGIVKLAATTLAASVVVMFPMLLGLALFVLLVLAHARSWPSGRELAAAVTTALVLGVAGPASAGEATVPLERYLQARERLAQLERERGAARPAVLIGETHYRGRAERAGLRLTLSMRAQLGEGEQPRTVPVVGHGAVILAARAGGRSVALERDGSLWVWRTRERGAVDLELELLVPPSGPRGSIEYRFGVVESPATTLTCVFPESGLSPKVTGAVSSQTRAVPGGTELAAILGPMREIHVVGFQDVERAADERGAKLYAETQNLFSLGDDAVELFSVVKLTILYAPQKRFRLVLPQGYDIVKADGEGAFQYTVADEGGRRVLTGETAYGIRQRYEISLRLERPLAAAATEVPLALPGLLDVERDSGFVAVEVPGKLSIDAVEGEALRGIDVRELPAELVESAVTPIVRAFQYERGGVSSLARVARYREKTLAAGGVDELRAETVLTGDGRAMTDLLFSLRNNLQQYLALRLPEGAEIRSAFLEGEPVKPSRDAGGQVLLPLVRSPRGPDGLRPIRVQLVYESRVDALGWGGGRRLELPRLALPLASLRWGVHVPRSYVTSALEGAVEPQEFAGNAYWQQTATAGSRLEEGLAPDAAGIDALGEEAGGDTLAEALLQRLAPTRAAPEPQVAPGAPQAGADAGGAMSVRIELPRSGREQTYRRYWVEADEPIFVEFRYLGSAWWLALEVFVFATVLPLLGLAALAGAMSSRRRLLTGAGALVVAAGGSAIVGATPVVLALVAVAALFAHRRGWLRGAKERLTVTWRTNVGAWRTAFERERDAWLAEVARRRERSLAWALATTAGSLAWIGAKVVTIAVLAVALLMFVARLVEVLGHPV